MPKNSIGTRWGVDQDGKPCLYHIPNNCSCGKEACYGSDYIWYCTECWQRKIALGKAVATT